MENVLMQQACATVPLHANLCQRALSSDSTCSKRGSSTDKPPTPWYSMLQLAWGRPDLGVGGARALLACDSPIGTTDALVLAWQPISAVGRNAEGRIRAGHTGEGL